MRYLPIRFTDEMVRAILDGTKTQHRLLVKLQPSDEIDDVFRRPDGRWTWMVGRFVSGQPFKSPFGVPGDRLWVQECWQQGTLGYRRCGRWVVESHIVSQPSPGMGYLHYRADREHDPPPKWRPSTNMPRWASRITLEVTNVRVEHILDTTEEDAAAEGCRSLKEFASGWRSIYGAWADYPWCWVGEFTRKEGDK